MAYNIRPSSCTAASLYGPWIELAISLMNERSLVIAISVLRRANRCLGLKSGRWHPGRALQATAAFPGGRQRGGCEFAAPVAA